MNEDLMTYECRVWDSVSGEWRGCLIEIPNKGYGLLRYSEQEAKLGQEINEAVSIAFDEDPGSWFVFGVLLLGGSAPDAHEAVAVHLLNGKNDLSVIVAIRQG
jgi:hypothetical protein